MSRLMIAATVATATVLCSFIGVALPVVMADNPLVPGVGMADPHVHVWPDDPTTAWMYSGRDASPEATRNGFVMPDWNVWSSKDLIHWTHENTIYPNQTYIGDRDPPECWAVDVAYMNGRYAFFFSNGGINLGVMIASKPNLEDAVDVHGRPLVVGRDGPAGGGVYETNVTTGAYDPTVLIDYDDEDGDGGRGGATNATTKHARAYLCFGYRHGNTSDYAIVRLTDDLTRFAERPRRVVVLPNPVDGSIMPPDDKSTLHRHRGIYYLSAGCYYATSESSSSNPYGPYTFRGCTNPRLRPTTTVTATATATGTDVAVATRDFGDTHQAHGRYWTWNGQWFHAYCEFVQENNTDDTVGTDLPPPPSGLGQGTGKGTAWTKDGEESVQRPSYARWRDVWMTYTHYTDDGDMVDDVDFLELHGPVGVGQYSADWDRIEAEWFMRGDGVTKVQIDGVVDDMERRGTGGRIQPSFAVRFDGEGSSLTFPNVRNLPPEATLTLGVVPDAVTGGGCGGGTVEVWNVPRNKMIATCTLSVSGEEGDGGGGRSTTISCPFESGPGDEGIVFVYRPLSTALGGGMVADAEPAFVLDWWSLTAEATATATRRF